MPRVISMSRVGLGTGLMTSSQSNMLPTVRGYGLILSIRIPVFIRRTPWISILWET
jgi:hypothetical protein